MEQVSDLKPAFNRAGNKYPMRYDIIPLIPPHKRYVELFAGSGAIFWNKEKAEENILNDLDKKTISQFSMLRTAPSDPSKYRTDIDTIDKLKAFFRSTPRTPADKLLWEKVRVSTGFNTKPLKSSDGIYLIRNPFNIIKRLPLYKELLQGVKLENLDYEAVVRKYDGKDTFFFIDPPYENTDKSFGYAEDVGFDFGRLLDVLRSIKGKFLMTINDSPMTRKLFREFHIKKVGVHNGWNNATDTGSIRKELIITNYVPKRGGRGIFEYCAE